MTAPADDATAIRGRRVPSILPAVVSFRGRATPSGDRRRYRARLGVVTTPAPAVQTDALVKSYATIRALDDVTVEVRPGTITALLGPNGAGKTTLVECCAGLRRPDKGTVRVLDAAPGSASLRPRVGVMLQEGAGLYPAARGGELLTHLAGLYARPADVDALAARLGLDAALSTPVRRLSGGERQRLALAAALVGRPELVFLDEPTAGLDPQARRDTLDLLAELREAGVTVVLTTHQIAESEHLYDDVILIDRGTVVAAGAPAALIGQARGTVSFSGPPALEVADLISALPPGSTVVEVMRGRYRVEGTVDPQALATIAAWCSRHEITADDLTIGRRGLEDVFLERTGRPLP